MWILPKQLIAQYPSAQVCGDSKEELQELASLYELSAMWKSKPFSASTWLSRWKRVWWISHLFGRTLKPSMRENFETEYVASLEVTHVNLSVLQANAREPMTHDTYGHTSKNTYVQLDLFGVSSRTLKDTLHSDMNKCEETYKNLVIQLRKEYLVRKKLGHHIEERDCSYLQSEQVSSRMTPSATMRDGQQTPGSQLSLSNQVDTEGRGSGGVQNPSESGQGYGASGTGGIPAGVDQVNSEHGRCEESGRETKSDGFIETGSESKTGVGQADSNGIGHLHIEAKELPTEGRLDALNNITTGSKKAGVGQANAESEGSSGNDTTWYSSTIGRIAKYGKGDRWPARPGEQQYEWEAPRTTEPGMGVTVDGYNFTEDLLRMAGNGVVEQTAALAWITLWNKILKLNK
jgi:hypothetical protein